MHDESDWPSHTEELTRKVTAELQKWTEHYEQGHIGEKAFVVVLGILYDTTSGLIDREVADLIADLHYGASRAISEGS